MQTDHSNALKGLGIAVVVFAALGIIGCLISMVMLAALGPAVEYASTTLEYDGTYYSYSDDALAAQILLGLGTGVFGWMLVCNIAILAAGIICMRNYNNPQKLGSVFGWGIAGAVLSFLGGGIVTLVLCIIIAVFANKDKQLAAAGAYGQPVAAAAPVQPVQPATPVQPVAPVQPAQPVAAAPVQQPAVQVTEVAETVVEQPVQSTQQ